MASQITDVSIVCSTVCSGGDQWKHQYSASLAYVRESTGDRWIPLTKGQYSGKCFHLMTSSCKIAALYTVSCYDQPRYNEIQLYTELHVSWWRHPFSALLAICGGNSPVTDEFPAQRPVTRGFYAFFDLRLNKRLRKQSWGWWCETPSHSPWRHCDGEDIANQSMMERASRTNSHSSFYMSQQIVCVKMFCFCMLTSWNRKTFCITGPLWGQCTGDRWFPSQRVSNADLRCFPWC